MPRKRLGQHFLTDPRILRRIVDFADPGAGSTVVEIGPGRGHLTRVLAERAGRVIAIEVDPDLAGPLRAAMPPNVEILGRDALEIDFPALAGEAYAVVANLPYNIATPLIERFIQARKRISSVTVLVQKEVAERILASPGTRVYGPLSVGIQHYAIPKGGFQVAPGAFRPPPKVHSRVVRLDWRAHVADVPGFRTFVGGAFSSRRKKLFNNLIAMFPGKGKEELAAALTACGLPPDIRPEGLTPGQFLALWRILSVGLV